MILLENKTGVDAPTVAYPFGKSKDNTGSNNGFDLNSANLEDYHQFFAKMFDESGITANGNPDNETNGFQLYEALRKITKPYKSYTALMSQTGTAAPVATVLGLNEVGAIVWTRNSAGVYTGTLTGAFVSNKTFLYIKTGVSGAIEAKLDLVDVNSVVINSYASGTLTDSTLTNTSLEIRVYD